MTLCEHPRAKEIDARILATDLCTRVLEKCREGVYAKGKVEPIPPAMRERYFDAQSDGAVKSYRVRDSLRRMLAFSRLNLSETPFPMQGPFDAVFCRNVMIYFDNEVRRRLLGEINRLLKPGGYLFVGHAESLTGMLSGFRSVQPSIYIKAA